MVWLICSALVMISGYFVLAPLFGKGENLDSSLVTETELDRLLDLKAVIGKGLADLDFERGMGRLSDADFEQLQASYRSEAAAVVLAIEHIEKGNGGGPSAKCPACGAEIISGKKFCADCGHKY
jgi:hypothetical protein